MGVSLPSCLLKCAGGLFIALWLLLAPRTGHAQSWQAAVAVPGAQIRTTAVNANGDVFVTGWFAGGCQFGGTTLTSAGGYDVCVAKWSASTARWAWAVRLGGGGNDISSAIAVNGNNVYVTGYFAERATFGSTTLLSAGAADVFVAKLTDLGASIGDTWALRAGGANNDYGHGIAVSGTNVYVTGQFASTATFGATTLTSAGNSPAIDAFVAKYTDLGSTAVGGWAVRGGGADDDYGLGIAAHGTSVYVTGRFKYTATFSGATLQTTGNAGYGVFVAKYADLGPSAGNGWALSGISNQTAEGQAVAANGNGVYVGGTFWGTATVGNTSFTSAGREDVFVAKYLDNGSSGQASWAVQGGGVNTDAVHSIAASGTGVYVTGYFAGTVAYGRTALTSTGGYDVYVAKYTDLGASAGSAWAVQGGGSSSDDLGVGLTVNGQDLYVSGITCANGTYGNVTPGAGGLLARLQDRTAVPTSASGTREPLAATGVYPTPGHSRVTLNVAPTGHARAVLVLDASGRAVRTARVPALAAAAVLELSGLLPGVYTVRCGTASTKLVVE